MYGFLTEPSIVLLEEEEEEQSRKFNFKRLGRKERRFWAMTATAASPLPSHSLYMTVGAGTPQIPQKNARIWFAILGA